MKKAETNCVYAVLDPRLGMIVYVSRSSRSAVDYLLRTDWTYSFIKEFDVSNLPQELPLDLEDERLYILHNHEQILGATLDRNLVDAIQTNFDHVVATIRNVNELYNRK